MNPIDQLSLAPLDKEDCETAILAREQLSNDQWTKLISDLCFRARRTVQRKTMN
jgi:hypothetical protein